MINISRLYCGQDTPGDWLRYGAVPAAAWADSPAFPDAASRRPVVVWNITRACNLRCVYCYSSSTRQADTEELSTTEAREVLRDLAGFEVPAVLFSGGEPLVRPDLFELLGYAKDLGLKTVLSTNGTLISAQTAKVLAKSGVCYVGVSIDGVGAVNDVLRAAAGAFDSACAGIKHCRDAGLRVGLRLTMTQGNVHDLDAVFDHIEVLGVQRACFYHLVPAGRAAGLVEQMLSRQESRRALDTILLRTRLMRDSEILTVDNHADGVYLYLKLLAQDAEGAQQVRRLLRWNGGGLYSSGVGIGCIDFRGRVHPDQFWLHYDLGDVRQKPFSSIWTDPDEPLLKGLRNRREHIKGRCRLCKFFDACGGSLRVRADLHYKDLWAPDPACYLTDDEIGLDRYKQEQLRQSNQVFALPL